MKIVTCFVLILITQSSLALTHIEKHTLSVSQGMASFYMYLLSQEDKKFLNHFEDQMDQATIELQLSDVYEKERFLQRWNNLKPNLKFECIKGMGASIDQHVRFMFRDYLVDLFLYVNSLPGKTNKVQAAYESIQVNLSVLVARALDLDSSIYGVKLLSEHALKLDPLSVSESIEMQLEDLMSAQLPNHYQIDLRRIRAKLKFIKSSIINDEKSSAIFLTYQNAQAINEMIDLALNAQQISQATSNSFN